MQLSGTATTPTLNVGQLSLEVMMLHALGSFEDLLNI